MFLYGHINPFSAIFSPKNVSLKCMTQSFNILLHPGNKNTSNGAYTIGNIIHQGDYVIIYVSKAYMNTSIARKSLNIVIEKSEQFSRKRQYFRAREFSTKY